MEIKYRICIAKAPDRKKPVADIFFEDAQWAEVNQDGPELQIEFFPGPDNRPWHLSQTATERALQSASERLTAGTKMYRKDSLKKVHLTQPESAGDRQKKQARESKENDELPIEEPRTTR